MQAVNNFDTWKPVKIPCLSLVRASDKRIQREDEYSDSEDEGDGGRKNEEIHKKKRKLESDMPKGLRLNFLSHTAI